MLLTDKFIRVKIFRTLSLKRNKFCLPTKKRQITVYNHSFCINFMESNIINITNMLHALR